MRKKKHYSKPEVGQATVRVPTTMQQTSWTPSEGGSDLPIIDGNPDDKGEDPYGGEENAKRYNPWQTWED